MALKAFVQMYFTCMHQQRSFLQLKYLRQTYGLSYHRTSSGLQCWSPYRQIRTHQLVRSETHKDHSGCQSNVKMITAFRRNLSLSRNLMKNEDDSLDDDILDDDEIMQESKESILSDLYEDQYLNPTGGHKVFIIHPAIKLSRRDSQGNIPVSDEYQLSEACALIDALPEWNILGKEIVRVPQLDKTRFFTKGIFQDVLSIVSQCSEKTAVFVNVSMLSGLQLATLQKSWHVPVYDRYTIILQIFHLRARTMEAKLQLKLAEIPYYRSRLRGMHIGSLDQQRGGLNYIGGSGETWMDTRYRIIAEKELSIRKKLESLKKKRHLLWQERKKKELPLVAVVGYTNAGKTSLIKALTKDDNLKPWDQVFATLDVTCHAGYLGNRMKVVYMDTVGFITNIPTNLIDSFTATLDDVTRADVIIHVIDISNPNSELQKATVVRTLSKLHMDDTLLESIIEVNNKVDLLGDSECLQSSKSVCVSTVTGQGMPELLKMVEEAVMKQTGRVEKLLKIPQSGQHLPWLYKEATVKECRPCPDDEESLLVHVVMTTAAYQKFCAQFLGKKAKSQRTQ